jgi:small subunit ribosomal protein S1
LTEKNSLQETEFDSQNSETTTEDSHLAASATSEAKAETKKEIESYRQQQTPGDFDWSMDKEGFSTYDLEEKKKMESFYENTLATITEKEIVKGSVVGMTDKEVVLNIGFKSDGLIPLSEFRDTPDLKVGDVVEVLIETTEDSNGQLVLSRKKAVSERAWETIISANENDTIVNGYVKSRTKGGLVVDVMGIDAFLPGSQIDIKPIRDYDIYVGQTMQFKVVKINHAFKNVVISHKALIEDDLEAQKVDILSKLEKGQVLEGTVKNMTSFGVFIDLGGLDGLLHITDISWGRINHPEEVLKLDQKINIVVLDFDDEKKRISLGLKQLTPHPWDTISDTIQVGSKVKGKIVTVADYGSFLEIAPGIEGLIHVSEMSWSQHLRNPQDFMKVADEMEAVVLTLDKDERKMSLGIKQLTPDPWTSISEKYPVGSRHKGIVRNLTNYGLFVELEEGVDGLVHVSDLSWSKKVKHPAEFIKKDEELEVVVLEVDSENRRLSLGHKQLDENPWETFESVFTIDSIHEGTVMKLDAKGATVALPYGVEGYAPIKHLQKENKSTAREDETLNFKVLEFSKENKRILLSHTQLWREEETTKRGDEIKKREGEEKKTARAVKTVNQSGEKSTLGEYDALSNLKAQLETSEKAAFDKKVAKQKTEDAAPAAPKAEAEAPAAEVKAPKEKKAAEPASEEADEKPAAELKEKKPKAKKADADSDTDEEKAAKPKKTKKTE